MNCSRNGCSKEALSWVVIKNAGEYYHLPVCHEHREEVDGV